MSVPKIIFGRLHQDHPNLTKLVILIVQKQLGDELSTMLSEAFTCESIHCEILLCNSIENLDLDDVSHVDFIIIVPAITNSAFEEVLQETALIDASFFHFTRVSFVCINLAETASSSELLSSLRETYKDAFVLPTQSNVTPFLVTCIKNYIVNVLGLKNGKVNILSRNMKTDLERRGVNDLNSIIKQAFKKSLGSSE